MGALGGMMSMDTGSSPPSWTAAMSEDSGPTLKPGAPKKGMALGKKKTGADIFGGMSAPEPAAAAAEKQDAAEESAAPPIVNPLLDPVKVDIDEKVTAELKVEGGLNGEVTC